MRIDEKSVLFFYFFFDDIGVWGPFKAQDMDNTVKSGFAALFFFKKIKKILKKSLKNFKDSSILKTSGDSVGTS